MRYSSGWGQGAGRGRLQVRQQGGGGVSGVERPADAGRAEPPDVGRTPGFDVGGGVEERGQFGGGDTPDDGGEVGLQAYRVLRRADVAERGGQVLGSVEQGSAGGADRSGGDHAE
jgi:hypothetical protein